MFFYFFSVLLCLNIILAFILEFIKIELKKQDDSHSDAKTPIKSPPPEKTPIKVFELQEKQRVMPYKKNDFRSFNSDSHEILKDINQIRFERK